MMNALQQDQKQGANCSKNWPAAMAAVDLTKTAKPIGTFGGPTDLILRFRNGELVGADTGDQGGGQN
jgi:hypothetical protein